MFQGKTRDDSEGKNQVYQQDSRFRLCLHIPSLSYIKPQLSAINLLLFSVVYLSFSTSNHNYEYIDCRWFIVVYLSFSTSNHNRNITTSNCMTVVYLSFSTSNHNYRCMRHRSKAVVYLSFSTSNHNCQVLVVVLHVVVYLSFSTSNHNCCALQSLENKLYIFHFLHQTTTLPPSRCLGA